MGRVWVSHLLACQRRDWPAQSKIGQVKVAESLTCVESLPVAGQREQDENKTRTRREKARKIKEEQKVMISNDFDYSASSSSVALRFL